MTMNTKRAIARRINAGETDFQIGKTSYHANYDLKTVTFYLPTLGANPQIVYFNELPLADPERKKYLVMTISGTGREQHYFDEYRLAANYRDLALDNNILAMLMQYDPSIDAYSAIA